jgi:hypothetical protein
VASGVSPDTTEIEKKPEDVASHVSGTKVIILKPGEALDL